MSKEDLISEMVTANAISKAAAEDMLKIVLEGISDTLKQKGAVRLVGFGTFEKTHRPQKTGRNPRTGAALTIAAMNLVKFKPGKQLKDSIN